MAQPRLSSQAPLHSSSFRGNSTQSLGPATDLPAFTPSLLLATKKQVLSGQGSTLELPQALYADHPWAEVLSAATTASPSLLSGSWEGWSARDAHRVGGSRTRSKAGLGEELGSFSLWGPSQLMTRGRDRKGLVSPP